MSHMQRFDSSGPGTRDTLTHSCEVCCVNATGNYDGDIQV